jgi:AraC-like DNA-binding protein
MKSDLEARLQRVSGEVSTALSKLDIPAKAREIAALEASLAQPETWHNPEAAQASAKKLSDLKNQTIQINEVCYLSGFEDANYFTRLFKKYEGITPKQYQLLYAN